MVAHSPLHRSQPALLTHWAPASGDDAKSPQRIGVLHLLQSGVDMTVIALWLGHESIQTTHMYVEADVNMKKRAISKITKPRGSRFQFEASDRLLSFLDSLLLCAPP